MRKFFEEFKAFALRGNVMDMAVCVIIAFWDEIRTATDVELRDRVMRQMAFDRYIDWSTEDADRSGSSEPKSHHPVLDIRSGRGHAQGGLRADCDGLGEARTGRRIDLLVWAATARDWGDASDNDSSHQRDQT